MDDIPFYKRPWFYITGWLIFLLIVYFWQIYQMGGVRANQYTVYKDLFCIFPLLLLFWMGFFSQFVLPVKTFRARQKIFDRLLRHLTRSHGPALFIKDGEIKEHSGERLRNGPGVVWLDSASAAVTRTAVSFKHIFGPGVHFTDSYEYIEKSSTLDLHVQIQKLGPKDGEKPFSEKKEDQSKEQYDEIQGRRKQVSALTRDGIELVPDISITFRVNTGFPQEGESGSRFGYRTGTTNLAKEFERQDQEIIARAILGEAINPNIDPESNLRRVAWNRLPGLLAAEVWREYAAKFTLDEFFIPRQLPPSLKSNPIQPTEDEIASLKQPVQVGATRNRGKGLMTSMLRDINRSMEKVINSLERTNAISTEGIAAPPPASAKSNGGKAFTAKTALQVINEMVRARLTQPVVDIFDEIGKRLESQMESEEYKILQGRGLKVISVSISNVRLQPAVQEQWIKHWSANWLKLAKAESDQLDRQRNLSETTAQDDAQLNYVLLLSREVEPICKRNPTVKTLLMSLLLRTRAIIRSGEYSNFLRRRMTIELQDIEDAIKWIGDDTP